MAVQDRDRAVSDRLEAVLRIWIGSAADDWFRMQYSTRPKSSKSLTSQADENVEEYPSFAADLLADKAIAQVKGYCTVEDMIRGELGLGADFSFEDE